MKQASYCTVHIALISELRIADYTLRLHGNRLPSTIYNSMAINCRLRSTTPIAVYDLQLHCNKLPSTIYYSRAIDYYLQSLSIQQKIPPSILVYSAQNTTYILAYSAENTASSPYLLSSKHHLQIPTYSAENNGGKYYGKYRRKLTAENTAENTGGKYCINTISIQ